MADRRGFRDPPGLDPLPRPSERPLALDAYSRCRPPAGWILCLGLRRSVDLARYRSYRGCEEAKRSASRHEPMARKLLTSRRRPNGTNRRDEPRDPGRGDAGPGTPGRRHPRRVRAGRLGPPVRHGRGRSATAMGERMAAGGGLAGWLFGRWTYEALLTHWNAQGGPFKDALNNSPKYVVSTTLAEPLPWPNSTLLWGDVAGAVRALKARTGGVLAIMGSGELIGSLIAADLIDEYLLMVHSLVLGSGRRLFPEKARTCRCGLPPASQRPPGW